MDKQQCIITVMVAVGLLCACTCMILQVVTSKSFDRITIPSNDIFDLATVVFVVKEKAALDNARSILEPISETYHKSLSSNKEQKKKKKDKKLIQFYFGAASDEDDVGEQLRSFADLPSKLPLLVMLDIPEQVKYICTKKRLTHQVVSDFLKGYQQGKLPKHELDLPLHVPDSH